VKTIVCFGDSNTWGSDPASRERFPREIRWPGVLARDLGEGYRVIEEALGGRTTNIDDSIEPHRNGLTYLLPCLESHRPFDLIAIMLGTNDLKARFNRSASDIAQAATLLARIAAAAPVGPGGAPPKVLLIAPPPVARLSGFDLMFAGAEEKSALLGRYYRQFADWHGLPFLDAGEHVTTSDLDGIHWEAPEHAKLARAVAAKIRDLLSDERRAPSD
jgi:lysophospholipase L1-like esterase